MTKFEKVKKALEEKTVRTDNYISVTLNKDARHNGKYVIYNVVTNNLSPFSYKSLNAIIKEYDLEI